MADNKVLSAAVGVGLTVATDEIAGVDYQRVKVNWGVDGASVDASASNPLPVVQTGAIPAGANAIGKLAANGGVVIGDVNAVTVPGTVADNAAGLPPVIYVVGGWDGTNDQALATNAAGNLQVGLSAAIPAGTNAIGSVTVTGTSVVDTELTTADFDTGVGTDTRAIAGIVIPGSGGGAAVSSTNPLPVFVNDGLMSINGTVSVTGTTLTDNAAFTDGTTKVTPAGYVFDEVAGTALTENDIAAGRVDAKRSQVFTLEDATTRGQRAAVSAAGRLSVDASGVAVPITDNSGSITVDAPVGTPVFTTPTPSTTGGWTPKVFTALTNTKTLIKASAGTLGGYLTIWNPNITVAYIQVFDLAATASVTLGTTVPDALIPIPPGSAANAEIGLGIHFANGIVIAITTTAGGSTAPGTGLDGTLLYK